MRPPARVRVLTSQQHDAKSVIILRSTFTKLCSTTTYVAQHAELLVACKDVCEAGVSAIKIAVT